MLDEWVKWSFDKYSEGNEILTRHQMKLAVISMTGRKPTDLPRKENRFRLTDLAQYVSIMNGGCIIGDVSSLYSSIDKDERGYVTLDDLVSAAEANRANISSTVIGDAFRRVDRDCDGRISYRDFLSIVNTGLVELGVFCDQ